MISDIAPFRMIGNLYFIGTKKYSSHLLATSEGLMLIDTGCDYNIENIREGIAALGFDIKDLKIILHSHGHFDHTDATAELVAETGAKTYLGRPDVRYIKGFIPDRYFEDGMTVRLGDTEVLCLFTPGHTEGAFSFFFDVEEDGRRYRCGMFGGAGVRQLGKDFMHRKEVSYLMRGEFLKSIERLRAEHVDVFVGNHSWHNKTPEKKELMETATKNPFIDPTEWGLFLDKMEQDMWKRIREESRTHFVNYAHRGASEYTPENTMLAFYTGIYMGANGIETDVRRTKDGVLVLHHDKTPERMAGDTRLVSEMTLAELRELNFEKNGHTDKIVTLEQFLECMAARDLRFAIELKDKGIEAEVAGYILRYKLQKKCTVTSFRFEYIRNLKRIAPTIRVGWLVKELNEKTVPLLLDIGADEICPPAKDVTPELVEGWHKVGLNVRAWGVTDEELMCKVYDSGADGMTVNFPDKLAAYIKQSTPENE